MADSVSGYLGSKQPAATDVAKNVIKVNPKQKTNPILRESRSKFVIVEDLVEDYQVNSTVSCLFLSFAFHKTFPLYIK